MTEPTELERAVARVIADIELNDRAGRPWTDGDWEDGLRRWQDAPDNEKAWLSGIDQPLRMARAAIAEVYRQLYEEP